MRLYNTSRSSTTVTGTFRELGPEHQIGDTVTENVSVPDPALPVPADGAQAAPDVTFDVPAGLDRLDADMIWPDATNGAILDFVLTDPTGRLRQISYDYGTASATGIGHRAGHPARGGRQPRGRHLAGADQVGQRPRPPAVAAQRAGHLHRHGELQGLRAELDHLAGRAPDRPSRRTARRRSRCRWRSPTRRATTPSRCSSPPPTARRPRSRSPGARWCRAAAASSTRRSRATVGRGVGQISTFNANVPAGRPDLGVTVTTPDTSADDPMSLYLVNPAGTTVATHTTTWVASPPGGAGRPSRHGPPAVPTASSWTA